MAVFGFAMWQSELAGVNRVLARARLIPQRLSLGMEQHSRRKRKSWQPRPLGGHPYPTIRGHPESGQGEMRFQGHFRPDNGCEKDGGQGRPGNRLAISPLPQPLLLALLSRSESYIRTKPERALRLDSDPKDNRPQEGGRPSGVYSHVMS